MIPLAMATDNKTSGAARSATVEQVFGGKSSTAAEFNLKMIFHVAAALQENTRLEAGEHAVPAAEVRLKRSRGGNAAG